MDRVGGGDRCFPHSHRTPSGPLPFVGPTMGLVVDGSARSNGGANSSGEDAAADDHHLERTRFALESSSTAVQTTS